MHLCRLCGEHKSPLDLNFELSDNTGLQWSYRELIEHHTRVALKTNKLLPQSICEECRLEIERFADFSSRVQNVQDTLVSVVDDAEEVKNVITHLTEISFQSDENCAKISKAWNKVLPYFPLTTAINIWIILGCRRRKIRAWGVNSRTAEKWSTCEKKKS